MITDLVTFNARLSQIVEENPDTDDEQLAVKVVDEASPAVQRDVLIYLTASEIGWHRRERARRIEEEARRLAAAAASPAPDKKQEDRPDPEVVQFTRLYDDPKLWGWGHSGVWFNSRTRDRFRRWADKRDGKGGFDAWFSGALKLVDDEDFRYDYEDFKADWIPGYSAVVRSNLIDKHLVDYAGMIRFQVTAELLDTVFATGDGTRVSWGDATVAQHEERISMLSKMIDGTAQTAAMHIRAVEMIKDAGVESLSQLDKGQAT